MKYREKYQSVQININKESDKCFLEWLYESAQLDGRSLNSFILRILKKEFEKHEKNNN